MRLVPDVAIWHVDRFMGVAVRAQLMLPGTDLAWEHSYPRDAYVGRMRYGRHLVSRELTDWQAMIAPSAEGEVLTLWWALVFDLADEITSATARAWADLHQPEGLDNFST